MQMVTVLDLATILILIILLILRVFLDRAVKGGIRELGRYTEDVNEVQTLNLQRIARGLERLGGKVLTPEEEKLLVS